jgi:hypothetical protein
MGVYAHSHPNTHPNPILSVFPTSTAHRVTLRVLCQALHEAGQRSCDLVRFIRGLLLRYFFLSNSIFSLIFTQSSSLIRLENTAEAAAYRPMMGTHCQKQVALSCQAKARMGKNQTNP